MDDNEHERDEDEEHGLAGSPAVALADHDESETDGAALAQVPEAALVAALDPEHEQARELTKDEVLDATEWLLDDEDDEVEPKMKTFTITLRPGTKIKWTLRALSGQEFKQARNAVMGNREQRRKLIQEGDPSGMDETKYHTLIVAQATVSPDLGDVAKAKKTHPVAIVEHRFRYLPGVLADMAGYVNELSGYDPDLVEEAVAGAAAGNS